MSDLLLLIVAAGPVLVVFARMSQASWSGAVWQYLMTGALVGVVVLTAAWTALVRSRWFWGVVATVLATFAASAALAVEGGWAAFV
ncbi:hypothetical protein OAS39_13640, partial [Pirellulales bacterium]|nr:hypothetical protein [Pirellulales bacterium]